jgi:hypothetical protein
MNAQRFNVPMLLAIAAAAVAIIGLTLGGGDDAPAEVESAHGGSALDEPGIGGPDAAPVETMGARPLAAETEAARGAAGPRATAAGLELVGTLATGDAATSIALIASSADAAGAMHYRVGETLPGGGVLTAVAPRAVEIDLDGRVARLTISTADGVVGSVSAGAAIAGGGDTRTNEQLAIGGYDGANEQSGVTEPPDDPYAAPVHRSRTGLVLSDAQREAMQAMVPED